MVNKWKDIWNSRDTKFDLEIASADEFAVYSRLKEMDGFDVAVGDGKAYYSNFYNSALNLWKYMQEKTDVRSVYEVGCGSGANLYILKNRGIRTGGIDYSEKLVDAARKILGKDGENVSVGEAASITYDKKWDVLLSVSVFEYFPNEEYGQLVLEKMYEKAQKAVIILEVFDRDLKIECEQHRRESIQDYDKKYEGLDKMFYPRSMFEKFAKERHCRLEFTAVDNDCYWNSRYQYNCIIYKN